MAGIDALDAIDYNEGQLEALFRRCPTWRSIAGQQGRRAGDRRRDADHPQRSVLEGLLPEGPRAERHVVGDFHGLPQGVPQQDGKYTGITSDTDGRIHARNSLEEIEVKHGSKGTLEPGKYILLRYLDPPWQGFYDIFKIINDDLLIGRVYLGEYPERRARVHVPDDARVRLRPDDGGRSRGAVRGRHRRRRRRSWKACGAWTRSPTRTTRAGSRTCNSATSRTAGFEARYQLMGLMEGLVVPSFPARTISN